MFSSPLEIAVAKVYCYVLPLLIIGTAIRSNDRLNLSLAKLKMVNDLPAFRDHPESIFGIGEAFNLLGSVILPIPSTMIIERWSAPKWFCLLSITWGVGSLLLGFITQPWHLYMARFFFGLTSAGYLTGAYAYITYWFPTNHQGKAISLILTSVPIAQLINPMTSYLLLRLGTTENQIYYETLFDLKGWQLLFITWGLVSILSAFLFPFLLPNRPNETSWLSDEERQELESHLEHEQVNRNSHSTFLKGFCHIEVLLLSLARFLGMTVNYGFEFFLPTILNDWYHPTFRTLTLLLLIPAFCTFPLILFLGWSSDRFKERYVHTIVPLFVAGLLLILLLVSQDFMVITLILVTVISMSIKGHQSPIISLSTSLTTAGIFSVQSIGVLNLFGKLGSGFGPFLIGILKDQFNSFLPSLVCLSVFAFIAVVLVLIVFLRLRHLQRADDQQTYELTFLYNKN